MDIDTGGLMKRFALFLMLLGVATFALADFPGSPIGGGGGTQGAQGPAGPSTTTLPWDNITGTDNAIIATTGTITGAVMVLDNVASPTAAQSRGTVDLVTSSITVLLPTAALGLSICVTDGGAAHDNVIVDVQAGDNVILVGVVQAGGLGVTNASGTSLGDYICLIATATNKWRVFGSQGTWASQ